MAKYEGEWPAGTRGKHGRHRLAERDEIESMAVGDIHRFPGETEAQQRRIRNICHSLKRDKIARLECANIKPYVYVRRIK